MHIINCIICGSPAISRIYKSYPGYIDGTYFDIYNCSNCNINFIETESFDDKIYELIYSNTNVLGYDRYRLYAEQVKKVNDPLKFLASSESNYYSVYKFLKDFKPLDTLEIGCGYGYLTYSLNKRGLNAIGIDLSNSAIEYAKTNFGENYYKMGISDYSRTASKKYDLIIATEVIEHLKSPLSFLNDCIKLLKPKGKILLTTPNKDFSRKNAIWQTDMPPVHTVWLNAESFNLMVSKLGLKLAFISFKNYFPRYENRLVRYLQNKKEVIQIPILCADGTSNNERINVRFSKSHIFIRKVLHNFTPVRVLSNFLYNLLSSKDKSLGIIISRK